MHSSYENRLFTCSDSKQYINKTFSDVQNMEVLEKAPPPPAAELTPQELEKIELSEESTMRSLRLFLRDVLTRLAQDRRFKVSCFAES